MTFQHLAAIDVQTACRAIGLLGFGIYVAGYYLLAIGRIDSTRPRYFVLCLAASLCVAISLLADFNLASALIQGFYIVMSLLGLALRRARPLPVTP